MRRSALIAAFLATTMLTPTRVEAAPVAGFVLGTLGIGVGTALGATAAFSAGAAFAGTFVGGLLVKTVLSVGLSLLAASLQPKPQVPPPSARMVNFAQPISYAEWVFGRTRKGGPLGFTGFKNNRRYYVPILAAHSIEGIVEHWLDEVQVTLNSETDQAVSNIASGTNPSGYGRINPFLGQAGQVVDPGLEAAFTEITAAHDFKGLAGAVLWAKRPPQASFSDIYPRGRQWAYAPVIDGNNQIYDPRDLSTGYTNNAALVLAYWLVNVLGRTVDWAEVATEADVCDELVTNAEGDTQPRWTINGTISDDQEFEDQRAQLAAACDAFLFERADGKVGFKVGRWVEPTITLTADDFLSVEITSGDSLGAPTEVAAIYTEPENGWRETPSGAWVEDTTTRSRRDEPALYLITNHNQAARMNRRIARTKRAEYHLKGTLKMIGYELLEQRFVRVILPEMGIDDYFEIGELAREGVAAFTLAANSVKPEGFDPDIEEPTRPKFAAVANANTVPAPASLSATINTDGQLLFAWPDQDPSLTQEIRYREDTETDWQSVAVPSGADVLFVSGFSDAITIEAQIRNVTGASRPSDWAPDPAITTDTVVDPTAPAALTAFATSLAGLDVVINFTAPDDTQYVGVRIYRAAWSSDFANASLIHTEYGVHNAADSHTDIAPGLGIFYYWAEPINASGVAGTRSGPESETVSAPGP